MEKMASIASRYCLRSRSVLAVCRTNGTQSQIYGPTCTARPFSSSTHDSPTIPKRAIHPLRRQISRSYSSSIQGTIAKGEAGIADEAARVADAITAPEHLNEKEREIWELLQKELSPTRLEVQDISGGCGSMYGIEVLSERFRGLSMLKQQRLVNQVLKEEIGGWHGVQLKTGTP